MAAETATTCLAWGPGLSGLVWSGSVRRTSPQSPIPTPWRIPNLAAVVGSSVGMRSRLRSPRAFRSPVPNLPWFVSSKHARCFCSRAAAGMAVSPTTRRLSLRARNRRQDAGGASHSDDSFTAWGGAVAVTNGHPPALSASVGWSGVWYYYRPCGFTSRQGKRSKLSPLSQDREVTTRGTDRQIDTAKPSPRHQAARCRSGETS